MGVRRMRSRAGERVWLVSELVELWRRLTSRRLVLFGPSLALSELIPHEGFGPDSLPYPLKRPETLPTFSGTAALARAIEALRLAAGERILCPAYNCGHELEPFLRADLELVFYRVDEHLCVDLGDLRTRLDGGVRAVLVTHYFGFAQPIEEIRELCDQYGVLLIEDCAHAFLSDRGGRPLGSLGDVAVFSVRKSLPLPDGGLLRRAAPEVATRDDAAGSVGAVASQKQGAESLTAPPLAATLGKTLDLWQKHMMLPGSRWRLVWTRAALGLALPLLLLRRLLSRFRVPSAVAWYDPDDEDYAFDVRILSWGMSAVSSRLLERMDYAEVRRRRRANYMRLAEQLRVLPDALIFEQLPPGTCPLVLPLRLARRDAVALRLYERGVTVGVWWDEFHHAVPWRVHPEAVALKASMLALPVHQDLEAADIDRMAREVLAACAAESGDVSLSGGASETRGAVQGCATASLPAVCE